MKITLSIPEQQRLENIKAKFLKVKKRLVRLIYFKSRYMHGKYLFIKCKQPFGVINHSVHCPNFSYQNKSLVLFGWMVTDISKV